MNRWTVVLSIALLVSACRGANPAFGDDAGASGTSNNADASTTDRTTTGSGSNTSPSSGSNTSPTFSTSSPTDGTSTSTGPDTSSSGTTNPLTATGTGSSGSGSTAGDGSSSSESRTGTDPPPHAIVVPQVFDGSFANNGDDPQSIIEEVAVEIANAAGYSCSVVVPLVRVTETPFAQLPFISGLDVLDEVEPILGLGGELAATDYANLIDLEFEKEFFQAVFNHVPSADSERFWWGEGPNGELDNCQDWTAASGMGTGLVQTDMNSWVLDEVPCESANVVLALCIIDEQTP